MTTSFVLGNGRSRLQIDPNRLKDLGTVYGCNAIYRDCMPHYLIAVDSKMIVELTENQIQNQTEVWTNYNKRYQGFKGLHYFNPSKGWSSGPTALWLSSVNEMNNFEKKHKEIYILGFDYVGVDNKYFNNVYADSKNYKRSNEPATFFGNWKTQTEAVMKEFKDIQYYRVVEKTNVEFDWPKYKNYSSISYEEFKTRIGY
jgi:hypothetical protein